MRSPLDFQWEIETHLSDDDSRLKASKTLFAMSQFCDIQRAKKSYIRDSLITFPKIAVVMANHSG